jgi:hypothetical protein
MSSTIITGLLIGIMLLVIASLVLGGWQAQRKYKRALAIQSTAPLHPLDARVTMILHMHEGIVVGADPPTAPKMYSLPASWYTRRRTLVSISFLLMVFLALFVQTGLAQGALHELGQSVSLFSDSQSVQASVNPVAHPPISTLTASQRIIRVNSADRNQYYNDYQWQVWSYSSCSGIAMEEVMNAYGRHYIASDVLQVELNMGVWSISLGLSGGAPSLAKVAAHFGFKASPNPPRTLQNIINVANKGYPVIVDSPTHIFVVKGGDSNYVYLVDSAPQDLTVLTHQQFLAMWAGLSVVITPAL